MLYASLDFAKQSIGAGTESVTVENWKLLRFLRTVSRRIDSIIDPMYKRQVFAPVVDSRPQRITPAHVNSADGTLRITGALLELSGVTLGGSMVTDVEAWPAGVVPVDTVRLTGCCGASWYRDPTCVDGNGGPLTATIGGTWGIHRNWPHAWLAVDTLAADITTTTATTFTVADVSAVDPYGVSPRLSIGDLVRIDSEYMEVGGVDTDTNTVTAIRGSNGTTAATHDSGAVVYRFEVEDEIKYATARQAGLMYARVGAYTTVEINAMGGEVRYPTDLLIELRAILADYNYGR